MIWSAVPEAVGRRISFGVPATEATVRQAVPLVAPEKQSLPVVPPALPVVRVPGMLMFPDVSSVALTFGQTSDWLPFPARMQLSVSVPPGTAPAQSNWPVLGLTTNLP